MDNLPPEIDVLQVKWSWTIGLQNDLKWHFRLLEPGFQLKEGRISVIQSSTGRHTLEDAKRSPALDSGMSFDLLAENTQFLFISLERGTPVKITVLNGACTTKRKCQLNALDISQFKRE